ncbi:LytR/AlgR family response regulator transcription factor [Undibacterium sp. Di24W]|uniref:LytR/AlgR family response regulator transcription factor n=1 Tax=Undibacterium sp. Di24W TaxID=3413033 RepID=UPI003BF2EB2E
MTRPAILIVDDEAPARARMTTLISDIQDSCPCDLVGEAADAQTALDLLMEKNPDIVLLDVQMPGMTGIELAQHIIHAKLEKSPAIIFVTAYDDYALKAFEVHAMDYLLKPVRATRLSEALLRVAMLRMQTQLRLTQDQTQSHSQNLLLDALKPITKTRQNFSVLEKNRVLLIPVRDVLFLKAEQKYVTIQTRTRAYLTEESLVSIEAELGEVFVRAHRNALVARDAIMGVERAIHAVDNEHEHEKNSDSWQVIVRDSAERLPISRRQWPAIKALVR